MGKILFIYEMTLVYIIVLFSVKKKKILLYLIYRITLKYKIGPASQKNPIIYLMTLVYLIGTYLISAMRHEGKKI